MNTILSQKYVEPSYIVSDIRCEVPSHEFDQQDR